MACQPALIGKADIASIPDDEMVKDPNAQYFPCRYQSRRQRTIFLARRRIATGMVVQKDDGRRRFFYRKGEDFAWVDNAERQTAFRYSRVTHDGMLGIEQNDFEDFVTQVTQGRMVIGEEVTTGCDFGSLGQRTSESTLPQFKGRLQLGRFGLPHTWDRMQRG